LGSVCPLCNGSGMLTKNQKHHWDVFSEDHAIKRCKKCGERVLVCSNG
jgi:DnaJ-class molecular chaperone